jgi:hypothetical protein
VDRHCPVLRRIKGHDPVPCGIVRALEVGRSLGRQQQRPPAAAGVEFIGVYHIGADQERDRREPGENGQSLFIVVASLSQECFLRSRAEADASVALKTLPR